MSQRPSMSQRPRVLFALVALSILLAAMQFSMVSVALPALITDLDAPLRWVGWTIAIYTLAQAVSMPITGRLSDQFGRRRVFVVGLSVFTVGSMVCALAPSIWVLIAGRALQGLGAGSIQPSAYGIVGDAWGRNRTRAIGMLSSVGPTGAIVGPNLGGVLVDTLGWRATFWINVPAGALVVLAGVILLRRSARAATPGSTDYLGAALLSAVVATLVYALTELARTDTIDWRLVVAGLGLSVLMGAALLRRERRVERPLIDLALLRRREFLVVNALQFGYGMTLFGAFSFLPLYAQEAYGLSSSEAGALLTPRAVAVVVISMATAAVLPRTGFRRPIVTGLVLTAGMLVLLAFGFKDITILGIGVSNLLYLAVVVLVMGVGIGITNPPANTAAIELAPEALATIAGLRGMFRFLGGVIATPLIVLIASRSSTTAGGLELAFLLLGVMTATLILLGLAVPERRAPMAEEAEA